MATAYSVNRALINAGTLPLAQGQEGGEKKVQQDTYVALGTEAIGSTITGVKLPPGAIVVGIKIKFEDMGESVMTFDVGDAVDDNRYYDDLDVSNAGVKDDILITGIGHKVGVPSDLGVPADDDAIVITTAGGVLGPAGQTFTILTTYI